MAKLYKKLQKALSSYEDRPETIITEQKSDESVFTIRGKDQGSSAWHYILVPANKSGVLKAHSSGATVDITKFGQVIEYRNHLGKTIPTSGWGLDPPKMIETWIDENYDSASFDEKTDWIYEKDDIRLCTMQRAIPQQLIGIDRYYRRHIRLHYIKLSEDLESSLARRAGLNDYDRIIFMNGVNVENYTLDQLAHRFDTQRHLPVEMLVCSPATYLHYKDNKKLFHTDLPTVQRLKPVYATSTSNSNTDTPIISVDENSFCAVQWEDNSIISTVSQSSVFKSPEFTRVNDICFVETEGQYRKGKIIFIGSYSDCEMSKTVLIKQTQDPVMNSIRDFTDLELVSSAETVDTSTTIEQLPNELFFSLFTYLDVQHLYNAFWGLNSRLNNLFQSYRNLSLTFIDKTDQLSMISYAPYIVQLIIDTSINCDFSQFPNLQTLVLCNGNSKHLKQIQPEIVPNLTHLSFLLGSKFTPSSQLVHDVFSNKFPFLRHVNLGRIDDVVTTSSWSTSPSLRFVSIRSSHSLIVSAILGSCPNLDHLQLHVLSNSHMNVPSFSSYNHPLRRFTLWSDSITLTFNNIDSLLTFTPNVQHLYLQTVCDMPFIDLANGLIDRLNHLSQFDCHIKETMIKNSRTGDLATIHKAHSCFNRIRCIEEDDSIRIFATE